VWGISSILQRILFDLKANLSDFRRLASILLIQQQRKIGELLPLRLERDAEGHVRKLGGLKFRIAS